MKSFKWLVLLIASVLVLGACSGGNNASKSKDGKIQISFINGFTGGDGAYMKKITDGFNASQDKYEIVESQEKDHYTKYKSGDYDMVVIHGNNLETYRLDGMIQEVGPLYEKAGLKESDFHQAGMDLAKLDGKLYGFPIDIHPLTMFYNKEFTQEAPKTYEDLKKLNADLQAKNKDLYALGVPSSGLVEFYMLMIAAQNGVDLQDGNALNFAQPEYADALMTFHDMVWKDKVSPAGLGLDGEFKTFMKEADSGKAVQSAIALTGPWYYAAAKEKFGDSLGVAPIPQIGKQQAAYGNAHMLAVSASVEDEEVKEGIAEFAKYMFTPENLINWADGGQAPVHLKTIEKVTAEKDKYQIAYQNSLQFDSYVAPPQVYQYGEQIRYMNEKVFSKLVGTENLTADQLMKELESATKKAQQIAETQPK
ncbi:ABC transporter substrate-binding protein [Mesobacillus foraminis]|uniref:Multiple sugar transport system substrate-binding protein n=1 Tax=Mesobacillus foraminis TaxID=279826 RepID=A0A4R2BJA1_9BACI|nr:extracellular solute-binding protein [Mesobacillus foraminis]TCN26683.1 multiple sugar transport system substrate-binding protein [Mesobacillus foraminis]